MGESRTRRGLASGRLWTLGAACAASALASGAALAQRSPASDKSGAQGLAGAIVQFEESPGRGILYLEAHGSLMTPIAPTVGDIPNASPAAAPKAAAPKAAPAKGPAPATATVPTNGASPLRAPQRAAAPPEGVALRR